MKAKRYLFSNMWSVIRGRDGGNQIFGCGLYSTELENSNFWACRETAPEFPSLVGYLDLPIRITLRRVLGLLTIIILKRVSHSAFFQSNKFTECKVKDEKEVVDSLMVFNLQKVIHPF